ncbi:NSFL1 cofactor p47 [Pectinophora gossypiella]|nr:NSFL1 cofactor p47 [Pectinophora gossypiella]
MSVNKDDTLRQFCDVTGADEARSRFFLESSNWQLEVALSSFYEHGGNADEMAPNPAAAPPSMPVLSDSDMDSPPGSPLRVQKKDKKKSNTNFATLGSLQQNDSSSEDEEGQAFYAGGSERSGQQILGPGKGRRDIVTEMFKSVRERGAVVFEDEPSTAGRSRGVFSGVGYRLGQTADDHEQVTPTNTTGGQQGQEQARSVRLRLYREGFTVDNGALRHYTDPENAEFLSCIRRGEIPPELSGGGGEVRVSLEDRRHEDCPRAASRQHVFSGKGQMLGSPTPAVVGATSPIAASSTDRAANMRAAQQAVRLDETQPVTTVQFRLVDGSRITGRFNHTHTVADLQQYVSRAEPSYQLQQFSLLAGYPGAELADPSASLAQANLLNSTVLQRLK